MCQRLPCIILILLAQSLANSTSVGFSSWKSDLWPNKISEAQISKKDIIPESDIGNIDRRIWIITTACLPWLTGTSINPLLRAAYLARNRPPGRVTLMVPWLKRADQDKAFPPKIRFDHPDEQMNYVRAWLRNEADMTDSENKLKIAFYAASYHDEYHSIFPMGDVTSLIPDNEADVCILEEPEHLNWFVIFEQFCL
jgi:digalactosyldiacylglycerol synthase